MGQGYRRAVTDVVHDGLTSGVAGAVACRRIEFAYDPAMATYACPTCGMSVNATCGECDAPLVNDTIQRDDGSSVQVSKCPNGHGKIKSPMCCGADMTCSIA